MAVESDRTRELRELAEQASREAWRRAREDFHAKWGLYWKCARCGGRLDVVTEDRYGPILTSQHCQHGGHDAVPVRNGYSWTR